MSIHSKGAIAEAEREIAARILNELVVLDAELCAVKEQMDVKDEEFQRRERRVAILRDALRALEEL